MKTYKKKTIKSIDKIYCDCCGQSCTKEVPTIKPSFDHEYAELTATWGYFSKQDGQQFDIQLCEDCFNEILDFIKKKRKRFLGCFKYPYDKDPLEGSCYFPHEL